MKQRVGNQIVCLALAVLLFPAMAQSKVKEEYVFGMHFESNAGMGSAQIFDIANAFFKVAAGEFGYQWSLRKYPSFDETSEAFLKGEIDAAFLWPSDVAQILEGGGAIYPWATFTFAGRRRAAYCLWQRVEDATDSLADIRGKTLLRHDYDYFNIIELRDYLAGNGMDEPLWKTFGSIIIVPSMNSAFMALAMGKADYYWTSDDNDVLLKFIVPGLAGKVKHNFCTDRVFARGIVAFNRKTVAAADREKYSKSLVDAINNFDRYAEKHPALKSVKQYMKAAKMQLAPAGENEYDYELKLYSRAEKNGWLKEAEYVIGKAKAAGPGKAADLAPDYSMCKEFCGGSGNLVRCVDDCMNYR